MHITRALIRNKECIHQNRCSDIPAATRLYGKSPTLNVVEEHPPQIVCDCPHVLFKYDVKLSPVGHVDESNTPPSWYTVASVELASCMWLKLQFDEFHFLP